MPRGKPFERGNRAAVGRGRPRKASLDPKRLSTRELARTIETEGLLLLQARLHAMPTKELIEVVKLSNKIGRRPLAAIPAPPRQESESVVFDVVIETEKRINTD